MSSNRLFFLQHMAQTSPFPLLLEIEGGEGVYLYGSGGRRWLDLISGIGVSALGHGDPDLVKAVQDQAARYMHTMVYGEYVLAPQAELARMLAGCLPDSLDCVYLVNSGTEATEGAMKLAKRFTGRAEIISAEKAYHGSTQGSASLMSPTTFTQAYMPLLPGIKHIRFNEPADLAMITLDTAAVIIETIQAESGLNKPDQSYMQALRDRCTATGTLLILDEIQAAYGRTGYLFAFEAYGIVPDILLLGKAFGGGMPLAAFIASKDIMQVLSQGPMLGHITTCGGHPVSSAAALAALRKLTSTPLISQVAQKEALFRQLLVHPDILELRSAGLWLALELDSFERLQKVISFCLEKGVIADWFLFNDRSMRIAPPLIIHEAEIRFACGVIIDALNATSG